MRAFLLSLLISLVFVPVAAADPEPETVALVRPPVTGSDYTEVRATVLSATRLRCPHAQVTLRVVSSTNPRILDVRRGPHTLTAQNYFWRVRGRINVCDARNIGAMAAYYLLPGDEIHAKLFPGPRMVGVETDWHIYGISRTRVDTPIRTPTREVRMVDGLELSLEIDRESFRPSEPIPMTLALRNTTGSPRTLEFSSGQHYDFVVRRAGNEIWRWSRDKAFIQAITYITVLPGETKEFKVTWDQKDDREREVAAGEYHAIGILTTMARPQPTVGPVTITIAPQDD